MLFAHSSYKRFPYPMSPDGDGGGAGDGSDGSGGNNPTAPGGHLDPERLKVKHGGAEAALRAMAFKLDDVERDNAKQRQEIAALKGKLPGEGSLVLTSEQAADWQTYLELGKPEEIKTTQTNLANLRRDSMFRAAADAHGLKTAVLSQLPGIGEFQIEVREQERDGNKVKVAIAKNKDGQERPLPELLDERWADFKPALVTEPATGTGTPWPKQDMGSQGADQDLVTAFITQQAGDPETEKKPVF